MDAEDKSRLHNENSCVESKEGERWLLSSNKATMRAPSLDIKSHIFPQEAVDALSELGSVLRRIRRRLKADGINIYDDFNAKS